MLVRRARLENGWASQGPRGFDPLRLRRVWKGKPTADDGTPLLAGRGRKTLVGLIPTPSASDF